MSRKSSGFSLVEILIVVMIIGIIAAIAIPNLLNAIQRGNQKRTMGDMRTTATAIESYAVDRGGYPVQVVETPVATIRADLEPTYVRLVPIKDAWDSDVRYATDDEGRAYTLTSFGRDRAAGGGGNISTVGATTSFRNDIIFTGGTFYQYPDGSQR
jgi:general secretion pathway protein G